MKDKQLIERAHEFAHKVADALTEAGVDKNGSYCAVMVVCGPESEESDEMPVGASLNRNDDGKWTVQMELMVSTRVGEGEPS
jgi:hypothetical protein